MLLTILKIILYIILILLLVILLLLAVILLARLKYSIDGEYDDNDGKFELLAKASWLFGLVKAEYCHGGENEGLTLTLPFGLGKKKKEETADTPENNEAASSSQEPQTEETVTEFTEEQADEVRPDEIDEIDEIEDISFTSEDIEDLEELCDTEPKKPRKKRKDKTEKTENKESFIEKIKRKYDSFEKFKETYDIPLLIKNAFTCIIGLLKGLGIKKGSIDGILGLSDPSQTGTAMGIISIANIYLPIETNINGDFAKKRIALHGSISGKTYVLKLLLPILVFIFKKPVRSIIWDCFFKTDGTEDKKLKKRK
ncbi:MAG: hypothetical protein IJL89_03410, partial [Firmicutes bacterium]|nr:hypothetical protein [Bacillota bacterium]